MPLVQSVISFKTRFLSGVFLFLSASAALAQNSPAPLGYSGGTLTENFDRLSNTTASPNTNTSLATLAPGFGFVETGSGADGAYVASTGGDNQGNTYSYGATGSTERALGGLQSSSLVPTFGVFLRNDTTTTLTQFTVAYQGEQYRLGAARTDGIPDRLDFQYSTTATTLNGTGFTDVDALDFASPVTTGTAGPVAASKAISATVSGVSVAPGAILVLRWNDFNVSSSDDGLAVDDFSFSTPAPAPNPTPTPTPGVASGALISEYRWSGPGGGADEFIELFNTSGAALDVSGWSVAAGGVTISIPAGTGAIPLKGHLLLTGSGYSLSDYGGTGQAVGDVKYSGDIAAGAELRLRNPAGDIADIVSGSGLPAPAPGSQWSYVRRLETGAPRDSGVDSDDFNLVEVNSASAGPSSASGVTSGVLRLGAPGPENRNSPTRRGLGFGLVNPAQGANVGDNGVRTGSGNSGTLSLRRVFTNITGLPLTRLRLRILAGTLGTPGGPDAGTIADVRLMDGAGAFKVNGVDVTALKVETLPLQNSESGGALNSTLLVTLPAGGIAPDATVGVEFLLRVVKSGAFRVVLLVEGASDDPPAPRPDNDNLLMGNPSVAMLLDAQASNKENLLVEHTAIALGYQKSKGEPRWVSWHLDFSDIGSSGRSNFKTDTSLPSDCQITDADYSGSGYTRGHQCPSGDRTASTTLNQEVFLMSNMVPQTAELNNGVWNDFEVYCRTLLNSGANELYILSGGVGSNGSIAGGKINVPASCWKVVVMLPKGGDDLKRISTSTRVLAVLMPNTTTVSGSYTNYYTTVDNIENLTGLDLLSNINDSVENYLEARMSN